MVRGYILINRLNVVIYKNIHKYNSIFLEYKGGLSMSGVTKHIYNAEIKDIHIMWNKQLEKILPLLPQNYSETDILTILKKYYPHEWNSVNYKKKYYDIKDKHLQNGNKKRRYKMLFPEHLICLNVIYKRLCSEKFKKNHAEKYNECLRLEKEKEIKKERYPKIEKINQKIQRAKEQTQSVTPIFLDKIIGLYEKKRTTQKDRVYLLIELKKYYNEKIINFFFKLNDTELNRQLREMAFYHLQSFNYQPRLRKQKYMLIHTKNKKRKKFLKKEYPYLTYKVPETPDELENRILIGKDQALKSFDLFISHSSKDRSIVRKFIEYKNKQGIYVFCDWINDSDYLKRNLLCEATLNVIRYRLDKSKSMVFIRTQSSLKSLWCKYEINYFYKLKKPIYVIEADEIINGTFKMVKYNPEELLCENYESLLFK